MAQRREELALSSSLRRVDYLRAVYSPADAQGEQRPHKPASKQAELSSRNPLLHKNQAEPSLATSYFPPFFFFPPATLTLHSGALTAG